MVLTASTPALVQLATIGTASAAEPADDTEIGAASAGTDAQSEEASRPRTVPFKSLSLTANPLAIIVARGSLNVEYLPAVHHAIALTPYVDAEIGPWCLFSCSGSEPNIRDGETGVELGYRFYGGHKGANGFYVGPSLILGYNISFPSLVVGGAIDIGAQHIFDNGFTIGAGGGFMFRHSVDKGSASNPSSGGSSENSDNDHQVNTRTASDFGMFRVLFTIGYSL